MKTEHANQIKEAILYLDSRCDGARVQDSSGFNKFDTRFGKSIASSIKGGFVTDKQLIAAHKMIIKSHYTKQLSSAGIEIPTAAELQKNIKSNHQPKNKINKQITIDEKDNTILIIFGGRPSTEERELLDKLPYRKWNPNKKELPWETTIIYARNVAMLFSENEYQYSESFEKALETAPEIRAGTPDCPQIDILEDGRIGVYFNGKPTPNNLEIMRNFQDRKWENKLDGSPWAVSQRLIEQVFELFPKAIFTQEFKAELQKTRALYEMSRSAKSSFTVEGLNGTLFPFQAAGVEFIEKSGGRCLLADEMGLGKTIQTLAYLQLHPELRPAILVVPATLKVNWFREANKWLTTDDKIAILSGRTPETAQYYGATILIINYEILTAWESTLLALEPKFVAVDEAHKCKNVKAQRTQVVQELAKASVGFVPMTGTPIRNRPAELFTQLNMIAPNDWNNWFKFVTRYNSYVKGFGMGAPRNLEELHEMIKPYMIRRTKKEVLKELPPKIPVTVVMEFDEKERATYNEHIQHAAMTTGAEHLAAIERAKQAAARAKLPAVIKWIAEFLESGEKLVVFAIHREITQKLHKVFKEKSVMVIGGISQKNKQIALDRFQNDPSTRLFVGNLQAAGVGITLTAASNVVNTEFPWTPDEIQQASDRCHRIGQTDSVTIWNMVAENTIDEDIVELLETKAESTHVVMDNKHVKKEFSILNELSKIIRKQTQNITETIEELQNDH